MNHTHLLDALNPEQRQAVVLPSEHALILAGAGSGKTRVLTTRIAWLLQQGVSPGDILAVTFTNKAAKEMILRLKTLISIDTYGMWLGTFHGLCHRFLRLHSDMAKLPKGFQILDMQDQLSAIKRLAKSLNLSDDDRYTPKLLQKFINGHKEEGHRPHHIETRNPETQKKIEIYQLYEEQCQREGVVDFGELLLRVYELLRDNEAMRNHYRSRFRHILIDEFQDTNRLQYAWIKLLAEGDGGGTVMAVGDDDQSIYAFRGANVGNMGDFVREFAIQHQVKLEQNYRSCGNILNCANVLIGHNQHRLGKNLRTDQGAGEPVRVYEAATDFDEARWIVEEIQALVQDKADPFPRKEIAVLYRSNAQSRVIETALFNAKVPYRVYGGLRFFERKEIKDALAYLRLLDNPHDDTSFSRVVNFPARGIGARSLEQLQDLAKEAGCSLYDAASLLKGRAGASVGSFVARIEIIREQTRPFNLRDLVAFTLQHSGLIAHYQTDKEGEDRLENLDELVNAAESFVSQEGFGQSLPNVAGNSETGETLSPLLAFLTHAALEAGDNMVNAGQDAVQLMTVHSSKGLEFDGVFLSGLEEGLFPHENSQNDPKSLEEERRLMYVAITRARRRLYISYSQSRMLHGQTRFNYRSRFLEELPSKALKLLTPVAPVVQKMQWNNPTNNPTNHPTHNATNHPVRHSLPPLLAKEGTGEVVGMRVGMRVAHAKFGNGTVLTLEGKGNEARAQINFPMHGVKWMALSVAKLTPVE